MVPGMTAFHSIAHAGAAIFEHRIESTIGGLEIDLASAPLPPGTHRLAIESVVGGIEIYLPNYVKFTIEGGPAIGGVDVHDGIHFFQRIANRLRMTNKLPRAAVANPDPSHEIAIQFVINGGVGGVDIYRLDVAHASLPRADVRA